MSSWRLIIYTIWFFISYVMIIFIFLFQMEVLHARNVDSIINMDGWGMISYYKNARRFHMQIFIKWWLLLCRKQQIPTVFSKIRKWTHAFPLDRSTPKNCIWIGMFSIFSTYTQKEFEINGIKFWKRLYMYIYSLASSHSSVVSCSRGSTLGEPLSK